MTDKLKLVCAHCAAINQFTPERTATDANCGKCKEKLLSVTPIEANHAVMDKHINHSALPVLVDFWAPWCGPCKGFAPTFENFAAEYIANIRCLKLDTEQQKNVGARYNIRSIPTLALFHQGKEVDRVSGALNIRQLTQWVAERLK